MARNLVFLLIALIIQLSNTLAQTSEVECSVNKRNGDQISLSPAHFDPSILPNIGDKVHLMLLVKSNLPQGKSEGYYELFTMEVVKITPENKCIVFRCNEDMESARTKTGIPDLNLNSASRVRIEW
jgi:hypothetical protein